MRHVVLVLTAHAALAVAGPIDEICVDLVGPQRSSCLRDEDRTAAAELEATNAAVLESLSGNAKARQLVKNGMAEWEESIADTCAALAESYEGGSGAGNAAIACEITHRRHRAAVLQDAFRVEPNVRMLPVPVAFSLRHAMTGPGLVLGLRNQSSEPLTLQLEFTRPSTQEKIFRQWELPAQGFTEFGHGEGWAFRPGDIVSVSDGRHQSIGTELGGE